MLIDLNKLKQEVAQKVKEVEAAYAEIQAAAKTDDTAKQTIAQEVFDAKSLECEAMEAKVAAAEKHQGRLALLRKIESMSQPASGDAGKVANVGIEGVVGKTAAQPFNHAALAHAHLEAFASWMQGKERSLSDEQTALLQPKSAKVREILEKSTDKDAARSIVMPPSLVAKCLGIPYIAAFDLGAKYGNEFVGKTITTINNATTNPSLANYLVPQEFRSQLQMLPLPEPTFLNRVTLIPSSTGTVTLPGLAQTTANEFGGVAFSWTEEAGEKPETEPIFTQTDIKCYELCGYTEISERALSRSALSLESILVALFRPALNFTLDGVIANGSGSNRPLGLTVAAGVNTVARATAGAVSDVDLVGLKHAVQPQHRRGAMFALSDSVEQGLENATDSFGRPLFRSSTANGPYDRLVGYPYEVAMNLPAVGTMGDVIYGDMRQYYLVMEEEVTIAKSEHYKFQNNVVAFKVFLVVGGRPMHPRAFAKLGDTTS